MRASRLSVFASCDGLLVRDAGSIGYTMSLFLVENSLSGSVATFAKLAVLLASTVGAMLAAVIMKTRYRPVRGQ